MFLPRSPFWWSTKPFKWLKMSNCLSCQQFTFTTSLAGTSWPHLMDWPWDKISVLKFSIVWQCQIGTCQWQPRQLLPLTELFPRTLGLDEPPHTWPAVWHLMHKKKTPDSPRVLLTWDCKHGLFTHLQTLFLNSNTGAYLSPSSEELGYLANRVVANNTCMVNGHEPWVVLDSVIFKYQIGPWYYIWIWRNPTRYQIRAEKGRNCIEKWCRQGEGGDLRIEQMLAESKSALNKGKNGKTPPWELAW